jgi:hypothetical protein
MAGGNWCTTAMYRNNPNVHHTCNFDENEAAFLHDKKSTLDRVTPTIITVADNSYSNG